MSSLLPLKPTPQTASDRSLEPKLVDFEDESAEQIISAVSSTTARRILSQIYAEPTTASEIATELNSSVQNISYHLDRLQDADLVAVVETWYSEQGREMECTRRPIARSFSSRGQNEQARRSRRR
nr:helix-turn-helix domain-containing protein [Haloarcula hispanica]